ncbi:inner membrane protein YpjD [Salinispirillum marinum]|uniref:Inner membrane protein YpjD n=2 Tax=Saccharospirillaceae TaxID=255527 RepID=A0ABV8BHD0_9GAMM
MIRRCIDDRTQRLFVFALSAALLYSLAAWMQWRPQQNMDPTWRVRGLILLAVVFHTWGLKQSMWLDSGLDLGVFKALSTVGLVVAIMLLLAQLKSYSVQLGQWLLPFAAISVLAGAFIASPYPIRDFSFGITLHILFSLLALAMFTLTMAYTLLLRAHERALKHHHFSALTKRLPPLDTMERTQFKLAWVGFILLTLAMVIGFLLVENYFAQHLIHKTSLTILAWAFFAVLFVGHYRAGWRAVMTLRWYMAAYGLLLVAFFGSKFVLEVLLQRTS